MDAVISILMGGNTLLCNFCSRTIAVPTATQHELQERTEAVYMVQSQLDTPLQAEQVVALLQRRQEQFPASLRLFAQNLLLLWNRIQTGDGHALTSPDNLRILDSYIYTPPPTYGRLATGKEGDNVTLEDLLRVVFLQGHIHRRIEQLGIKPINPAEGDPFDAHLHETQETDMIWTQNPVEHNRVAAVKRLGYQTNDAVLRKADVKRLLLGGISLGESIPPHDETDLLTAPSIALPVDLDSRNRDANSDSIIESSLRNPIESTSDHLMDEGGSKTEHGSIQPPVVQHDADRVASDKSFSDKSFSDKPFSDKSFSDKSFSDKPFSDKSFSDKPFSDKSFSDKPFSDKPFSDKPFSEELFSEEPFSDQRSMATPLSTNPDAILPDPAINNAVPEDSLDLLPDMGD